MPAKSKAKKPRKSTFQLLREGWEPYKQLARYIVPYKRRFASGLLCGVFYGLTNGLLPLDIKIVVSIIFPESSSDLPEWLQRYFHSQTPTTVVLLACLTVPLVMGLRSLFSYLNSYAMAWVSLKVLMDIRRKLFTHMTGQSLDFFNRSRSGQLISRISNDTRMAQQALTTLSSDVIKQPIAVISGVAVLFWIDWKFCLTTLFLFPICLAPMLIYGRKIRLSGREEEQTAGAMMVILQETFAGIKVIKSFAREQYEVQRFEDSSEAQFKHSIRVRKSLEIVGPIVEVVGAFGTALALLYVYFAKLPLDKFIGLNGGILLLYPAIKSLSRVNLLMQKCLSATTNIFQLMETESTIQDAPGARELKHVRGEIQFEEVSFSYVKGTAALRRVSLHIQPGQNYALVGASGAGKSTLFSLLLRFYDPIRGRILVDGNDLRSVTQRSLRENIGIVTQDTFLFHDTIFRNIQYGRFEATEQEVYAAARQAFAHEFILAQARGYQTVIGDKGCLLSGGQQQRLAIARALLKNAPILLLDEATSALDSESEKQIQLALDTLAKGRTVIAIAHRLSTILKADQIVVLDRGAVVGMGPHDDLIETSPVYRRLYDLQFNRPPSEQASLLPEPAPAAAGVGP
jgi:subfamily B ATP-binding cassette protein MsbA